MRSRIQRARSKLPSFDVRYNLLPSDVLHEARQHVRDQPERKVAYQPHATGAKLPDAIRNIPPYIPGLSKANTFIAKQYAAVGDQSEAFKPHRDPKKFAGHTIRLITLGGRSILSIWSEPVPTLPHWRADIYCRPNTVVELHKNALHATTPPLGGEPREFLFAGTDSTLPAPDQTPDA